MGRKLTVPVDKPDLAYQQINAIHFEIPDDWDGNDVIIAKNSVRVTASYTNFDSTGAVMGRSQTTLHYPDWPQTFKDQANALYTMIENWMETQGIIEGSGTTETF